MVIAHPGCGSSGARSDGGRTSHESRARPRNGQSNWPTGGGTVVDVVEVDEVDEVVVVEDVVVDEVDVDVDVLDDDDDEVAGLVVVVLLVVVGAMVVVTDLVRAVVAAGGSVDRDGALLDPSHPIATTPSVIAASVANLLTGPRLDR